MEDISAGGLFLRTEHLFPKGLAVSLVLIRPGQRSPVKITGKVATVRARSRRNTAPGVGIAFDAMGSEESARLEQLLRELRASHTTELELPRAAAESSSSPRLMIQVQALLLELSSLQSRLSDRERALEDALHEIQRLKFELRRGATSDDDAPGPDTRARSTRSTALPSK